MGSCVASSKASAFARAVALGGIAAGCALSACGGDDEDRKAPSGSGGRAGRGGSSPDGSAGTSGAGRGGSAGSGGSVGVGGSAATGGTAGSSGTGGGGSGGAAGSAGTMGSGGTPDASSDGATDATPDATDASIDAAPEAGADASDAGTDTNDAGIDASDAGGDASPDVPDANADATVSRTFNSQPAWQTAASCATLRALYFDGPTETQNRSVVDPAISPSYASLGVEFQPFLGTTVYPVIFRNQQFQISVSGHDGLVANNVSPRPTSDLQGRAIRATFTTPVSAFGVHTNNGDGGHFDAFDAQDQLILQVPIASGGFGGLVSSVPIARVAIVNTFDSDIRFGIFGFQFCAP